MIEKLTQEQIDLQSKKRDEWIDIALHRQEYDEEEIISSVKWLYYVSNLKEPEVEIIKSPKDFADKLGSSVGASMGAPVEASVRAPVWASVRASVEASVEDSVWASMGAPMWASVRASVRASVEASVRAPVWASVRASVEASVEDSVRASVWASMGAPMWASVRASVRASVWASMGAPMWASVRASVEDSVGDSVSWACLLRDAAFGAWYEYWKETGILEAQEKADEYVAFLRSGIFCIFLFEKKCFVMLRPTVVKQDEQKRLHSETGMALEWQDGTGLYKLHGVTFEKEWWSKIVNDEMSPEEILAIDNTEHRRIAWEYMNKKKLEGLKAFKVLDELENDGKGYQMRVIQFNHPDAGEIRYLNCFCPTTGREYYLGTEEKTCVKAKARSFGFDEIEFIGEW